MLWVTWILAACSGLGGPETPSPKPPVDDMADEMAVKQAVRMPHPWKTDAIDWAKARADHPAIDLGQLPEAHREAVANSPVPVLLPNDPALLGVLRFYTGDGWYTATMHGERLDLLIRGTRRSRPDAMTREEKTALEQSGNAQITRTSGIVTCSFSDAGAAYNLELECKGGGEAPECSDEAVTALWKQLGFAGGNEP